MRDGLVFVGGIRTPMAEYNGHLSHLSAVDLGVLASEEVFRRTGVRPDEVDHAIFGNVLQTARRDWLSVSTLGTGVAAVDIQFGDILRDSIQRLYALSNATYA